MKVAQRLYCLDCAARCPRYTPRTTRVAISGRCISPHHHIVVLSWAGRRAGWRARSGAGGHLAPSLSLSLRAPGSSQFDLTIFVCVPSNRSRADLIRSLLLTVLFADRRKKFSSDKREAKRPGNKQADMLQMWGRRRPNLPCWQSVWRACAGSAAHGETGSRAEPRTTAAHRSLQGFLGYLSPKWKSGSAVEGTLAQGTATAGASPEQTTPMHAWNGWRVLGRRFKSCHQNRGSGVTPSLPRADAQDMLRSSCLTHRVAAFSRGKSFPEIMPSAADSRSQKAYMLR